jgi:hypothetical protein
MEGTHTRSLGGPLQKLPVACRQYQARVFADCTHFLGSRVGAGWFDMVARNKRKDASPCLGVALMPNTRLTWLS